MPVPSKLKLRVKELGIEVITAKIGIGNTDYTCAIVSIDKKQAIHPEL